MSFGKCSSRQRPHDAARWSQLQASKESARALAVRYGLNFVVHRARDLGLIESLGQIRAGVLGDVLDLIADRLPLAAGFTQRAEGGQ